MNLLIIILCVYIIYRVRKQRQKPCLYERHETTHTQTLTNLAAREVRDLRRELKDAGVIR